MREGNGHLKCSTYLHVCRTSLRHSVLHRRMQLALLILRKKGRTWNTPMIKKLVVKYGAEDA
jgi:hypothetical protein